MSEIDDIQEYPPLPEGKYHCILEQVDVSSTKSGTEMWKLRFRVKDGQYQDRLIFDNLVLSKAALPRLKRVVRSLGIDTSKETDILPGMLEGRSCFVTVFVEEYNGEPRNGVPFAGYSPSTGAAGAADAEDETAF